MWLSLVERCVRDAEAAGSNPVISTRKTTVFGRGPLFLFVFLVLVFLCFLDCLSHKTQHGIGSSARYGF